ncbi:27810_t:CDS:2, partial [Dentiscutata erythropus]
SDICINHISEINDSSKKELFLEKHTIILFISFRYDLSKYFPSHEWNKNNLQFMFRDFDGLDDYAPIAKIINDIVLDCWTNNRNINVFVTADPIYPVNVITSLIKRLRLLFDCYTLKIIAIWVGVYHISRAMISNQCDIAGVSYCIQVDEENEVAAEVTSYIEKTNMEKDESATSLLNAYREFNNSYPAATKIDGQIWCSILHYVEAHIKENRKKIVCDLCPTNKSEWIPTHSVNSTNQEHYIQEITRNALYLKFSQHPKIKHKLLSTGNLPLGFLNDTNVTNDDMLKSALTGNTFIKILEETRTKLMQESKINDNQDMDMK